jgi:HTH-type transcriptional regulator/antitoxin HipB
MTAIIINNNFQKIASIVRFHRKQAKLSRIQLAEIAGIGKTVIYDVENGKASVRFETLQKIFSVLNITVQLNSPLMHQLNEIDNEKS